MNEVENIYSFAQMNACSGIPKRLEDINLRLPYIHVQKDIFGKWDVVGHNYEKHDNAPRMALYQYYFKHAIFPNVSGNISGYYNIELHDSYTYLNRDRKMYDNVLTYSKFKDHKKPILIPDPYMVVSWNNLVVNDSLPWVDKKDSVCFYGTTTGDRNPEKNRRIEMCLWALNKNEYDFKITNVAQMTEGDIISKIGYQKWNSIYQRNKVPISDQLFNKFHFLPDGNTCKFDTWYFNTNTLNFKDISKDMLWYYPMLMDKMHYVEVNEHTLEQQRMYYINNPREALFIIRNAKHLYENLFKPQNHMYYTSLLFETMAY